MKIAFITFEYPPSFIGGAGIYAFNLTNELAKLGHQVVIFTPNISSLEKDRFESGYLKIERIELNKKLPFKALQFWLNLPKAVEIAERKGKFDIIHFNGISYWFLKKLSKAQHVITIHHLVGDALENNNSNLISRIRDISGETGFLIPLIEKRSIKCTNKIIAVSNFTKKRIGKIYTTAKDNVVVIYNGINLKNKYTIDNDDIEKTKKHLGLDNKPILLFVGRVAESRKGLNYLLKIFKCVLEIVDCNLLIVGSGDQSNAKKLIKSFNIGKNVTFTGYVDEITLKKIYTMCDIYICTSRLEGFGLTITEAMAAGKPIIATRVGAIPEIVENGKNGILVELEDIDGMVNAICEYLENTKLAEFIGERNAIYVKEKFSWKKNAIETEKLYIQLLR